MLICCLQVLKYTAGAADSGRVPIQDSLIFFVYTDSGVGLLYLGLEFTHTNPPICTSEHK